MVPSKFILLALASVIPTLTLADRGHAPIVTPSECNAAPTETGLADDAPAPTPPPECSFSVDPSHSQGLCDAVADDGWCDCGEAGTYKPLDPGQGPHICAYKSIDPHSSLILSGDNCGPAPVTTQQITLTVVPIEATPTPPPNKKRDLGGKAAGAVRRNTAAARRSNTSRLSKRNGQITFSDSCNKAPPEKSSYNAKTGFPSMRSVLEQAYADARALAASGQNVDVANKGFTHYFGGEETNAQHDHFKRMLSLIADNNNHYSIRFECEDIPDCANAQSVFVTDATPGNAGDVKSIQVCPRFWIAPTTKFLLPDDSKTDPPSPPYHPKNEAQQGYCRKSPQGDDANVSARTAQYYATAGMSMLHELTHLDTLASQAGLQANPSEGNRHGTDDIQDGCELDGARAFLQKYKNKNTQDASPDYNAESYAAAATEIYFMELCGISEIRPIPK